MGAKRFPLILFFLQSALLSFPSAHEDAVLGYSVEHTARKNEDVGNLVHPKMFKQHLPVDMATLQREMGTFTA